MSRLLSFRKVVALPAVLAADTLYMIPDGTDHLRIHMSTSDGTASFRIPTTNDIVGSMLYLGETAPVLPSTYAFWWDSSTGQLMVKYNDGTNENWIEATPATPVPAFGGDGIAETMSRSDHTHSRIVLESVEW